MALLPDVVECGQFELRAWRPALARQMLTAIQESLPELEQWMPWAQSAPGEADLRGVLRQGELDFREDRGWDYAMVAPPSGEVLGAAGIHRTDRAERFAIGYWVRSRRTGEGLATAAARALTDAGFQCLERAQLIVITMDRANAASAVIPRKLGYSLLGTEDREIQARGHTGRGLVFGMDRSQRT